tara:strand:- start:8498 stop:9487 length:990 start_codon:yes stop_codon:yes gene_type:complete
MTNTCKAILLTGATGFIGQHVCRHLLRAGFKVKVLIREKDQFGIDAHPNLEHCFGDLRDVSSLLNACANVEVVVHLASSSHANNAAINNIREVNVFGTQSLLSAAIRKNTKKFIFVSSSLASNSGSNKDLSTDYGLSKLEAERIVLAEQDKGTIETVILRPVNVYGEGMKGNISSLISLISRGFMPRLPKLDNRISLLGVDDLSFAVELAIDSEKANGRTYLLTDGQEYPIYSIEREIYRALGREMPRWKLPLMLLYTIVFVAVLLIKVLGFFKIRPTILSGLSLRTYHNLVSENLFKNNEICNELGFRPKSTFYSSLPKIVETINHRV